jgi:hypothetical protein
VRVLKLTERGYGRDEDERAAQGQPAAYQVKFKDGLVDTAMEDELLDSREHFTRPDPPAAPALGEAKERIKMLRYQELADDFDRAVSHSIAQPLEFRLVPVGATFIHQGKIKTRNDSDNWAWDFFGGGYSAVGDNETVKPVSPMFSPYDNVPFPEEVAVLYTKLRR